LVIDATALGLKKIRKKKSEKIQKAKSPAHMLILYVFGLADVHLRRCQVSHFGFWPTTSAWPG